MPFKTVEYAEVRGTLPLALAEYCDQNRIDPDSEECDDARQLMIMLDERQARHTVADRVAALVTAIHRER